MRLRLARGPLVIWTSRHDRLHRRQQPDILSWLWHWLWVLMGNCTLLHPLSQLAISISNSDCPVAIQLCQQEQTGTSHSSKPFGVARMTTPNASASIDLTSCVRLKKANRRYCHRTQHHRHTDRKTAGHRCRPDSCWWQVGCRTSHGSATRFRRRQKARVRTFSHRTMPPTPSPVMARYRLPANPNSVGRDCGNQRR